MTMHTFNYRDYEPQEYPSTDPLEHLFFVAYGAHPFFGAWAARRASRLMRLSHGAQHEFDALTLASDTFARYPFTLTLAYDYAWRVVDSAEAAGKPADVIAAWRARAAQIHAYATR